MPKVVLRRPVRFAGRTTPADRVSGEPDRPPNADVLGLAPKVRRLLPRCARSTECLAALGRIVRLYREADPVLEVQHRAAERVECFYPDGSLPVAAAQALGLVALRTDDVWLRHTIYRMMVARQRHLTGDNNWCFLGRPISFKYLTLPVLFDPEHLRELLGLDAHDVPIPVTPPPPVAPPWWRRLITSRWVK